MGIEAKYVVAGPVDNEDGQLYWSNDVEGFTGWGFLSTASVFTKDERETFDLPVGDNARWVLMAELSLA